MFWIITGVVVVVLLALAWFSSGFVKKPNTVNLSRGDTAGRGLAQGTSAAHSAANHLPGPTNS